MNAHHTHQKTWLFGGNQDSLLPQEQGKGGLRVPTGAGQRVIISHAGGSTGFVENSADVFIGKTGCGDYHNEKNTVHFMSWFNETLLPNLPTNSVIVLDNAKYHNKVTLDTRSPTASWRKHEIQDWLNKKGIIFSTDEIKAELLQKVKVANIVKVYETDETAGNAGHGISVFRLPVGHCELNPIELIWAWVKRKIADRNKTFKIRDVDLLARQVLGEVSREHWVNAIEHVKKVEQQYWQRDGLLDIEVEPLIIAINDEDDDENDVDFNIECC